MRYTNLSGESDEYRRAREELREAELELTRHRERVAALRRELPPGPVVEDYEFTEVHVSGSRGGPAASTVRLRDLFSAPTRPLVVYQFMFGKRQDSPCPMCTMWIDGFNGVARHVTRNVDFAIVAAAEPDALGEFASSRGWDGLRLLSAGTSTFKFDFGSEDELGNQDSRVSVFFRDERDDVRHFYTASPRLSDHDSERGIDLLCPTWHLLDLTPGGRGNWYSSVDYPA